MDYLLKQSTPEAAYLLENCVFKVLPMINTDGVIHGNTRCDIDGLDMNKQWMNPLKLNSTVKSAMNMIKNIAKTYEI